jgi:hypothetical protein
VLGFAGFTLFMITPDNNQGLDTVNRARELNICKDLKIERLQGYYFSKPISVDQIASRYLNIIGDSASSKIDVIRKIFHGWQFDR